MSRNSGGTYSLPAGNPVSAGETITVTWGNNTLNDIATEITNSLDRSGRGGMTAELRLFDGSISLPGLAFGNDQDLGWYRAGANDMRAPIAGADVLRIYSAGLQVTGVIELGHASDTTIARGAPGVVTIEGATVPVNGVGQTWTTGLLELGHATDTSLSRLSAGVLAVEGNAVPVQGTGQTWTTGVLELGHASDTTLSRLSAGQIGVEGLQVFKDGNTAIELGHASDTTISRVSAGVIAVEGNTVPVMGTGQTWTTGAIELGHASDTTLARIAAGRVSVEGLELGYRGLPSASVTTGAFAAAFAGKCVYATGGVTIPNSAMAANDAVVIQNTTGSGITITKSITTAYNTSGGAALGATFTLGSRGRCSIIFTSATECYVSGNIS